MGWSLQVRRILSFTALLVALVGITGCASVATPAKPYTVETASHTRPAAKHQARSHRGLTIARGMIGTPYRYGGTDPRGFDCSGLVYYSFRKANIDVPRTTTDQYRHSSPVKMSSLRPGDLIFFRISRNKLSHVGIYAGNDRFVHAPSGGKRVSYASLDNPYWESRVIGAGRY